MNTFNKLWGVVTPKEARDKIEEKKKIEAGITEPKNLGRAGSKLGWKDDI